MMVLAYYLMRQVLLLLLLFILLSCRNQHQKSHRSDGGCGSSVVTAAASAAAAAFVIGSSVGTRTTRTAGALFPTTTSTTRTTTKILAPRPSRRLSFIINNKKNNNREKNNENKVSATTSTTSIFSTITDKDKQQEASSMSLTNDVTTASSTPSSSSSSSQWFPTRIQDTLTLLGSNNNLNNYSDIVSRLYLRQVVTETKDLAIIAMKHYARLLTNSSIDDPFGYVANTYSCCYQTPSSTNNGGTIGWVDVNTPKPTNIIMGLERGGSSSEDADDDGTTDISSGKQQQQQEDGVEQLVPRQVLEQLCDRKPKAGDMYILESPSTQQWHLIQVAEIWLNTPFNTIKMGGGETGSATNTDTDTTASTPAVAAVGSFKGHNIVQPRRSKLKGKGILPEFPSLTRYSIQTTGCQMNVADSERLAGILENDLCLEQITTTDDPIRKADLVLWNTCSIRDHAEQKLYNSIGPYAAMKRRGERRIALIVTGCVAQQEGISLLKRIPEIDAVIGPQYIPFLKSIVESIAQGNQLVATSPMMLQEDNNIDESILGTTAGVMGGGSHISTVNNNNNFGYNKPIRGHDVRAWVNVIYGCNEHCTYCVVPSTRGMEQSRSMEAILSECMSLVEQGYREITLIGQNIDAYGRDMKPRRTFADLLEFLNQRLPSNFRIRYVTSHPRYFSERVIDAVASLDKVCECFHMPFQAGDDVVLRKMRRGYTYDSYMNIIHKIREVAPDAAITADVIVGFPYETDEAFEKTLQLMEEVKFDNINSFCYSPRPNTEAALWDDHQILEEVKSERLQRVQELATKHALERSQRYLGRIEEVLVEGSNPRNPSQQVMGRTRQGRQVYFNGDLDTLKGRLVNVLVTEARTWSLMGEIVEVLEG